jgi:hypothetical protein
MNTKLSAAWILIPGLLLGSAWVVATEPLAGEPTQVGGVLVLDDERIMEGDIARIGDRYRVRRTVGETWVPAQSALHLCTDRTAAYRFLRERANLRDPDERIRLAKWCQLRGLRAEALVEARAALTMDPRHRIASTLVHALENTPKPTPTDNGVVQAGFTTPAQEPDLLPTSVELSTEAMGLFVSKVQPILMNTCAGCHAAGKGGHYKLQRTFDYGSQTGRAVTLNVSATVAHLNHEQPLNSPLLLKAISAHGDSTTPPLKGRNTPAYKLLEQFVRLTTAHAGGPTTPPAVVPASFNEARPVEVKPQPARPVESKPADPKPGNDPFDPALFNRAP